MLFEVQTGYWKSELHTIVVTDDVLYAREQLLAEMVRSLSQKTVMAAFAEFEERFGAFVADPEASMFFSIRDYHYSIRVAQVRVYVKEKIG